SLSTRELSALARRGSGSAARSLISGVSVWHAADTHAESFAEPLDAPPLRMVLVTVNAAEKPVSSRIAMERTRTTSPYYEAWVSLTERVLGRMIQACKEHDLATIGELTESHALRMHGVIE